MRKHRKGCSHLYGATRRKTARTRNCLGDRLRRTHILPSGEYRSAPLVPVGLSGYSRFVSFSFAARRSHTPAHRQAERLQHSAGTPVGAYWIGWIRCQTSRVRHATDRPPPAWSFPDGRCTTCSHFSDWISSIFTSIISCSVVSYR